MCGSGRSSQKDSNGVCEDGGGVDGDVDGGVDGDVDGGVDGDAAGDGGNDGGGGDDDEDEVDDMDMDDRSVVMASANFRLPHLLRCK